MSDILKQSHWAFVNGWKVEPQSNDRPPPRPAVVSAVAPINASPSALRSTTRRKRQQKFKEWSQARHD
ncbi:MAG: hypothetical protein ABJC10_07665 [Acidobacteriota bacterium]